EEIDRSLKRYKTLPGETLPVFRRYRRLSRLPAFARRLALWAALNLAGRHRARYFGTFGVTTTAGAGTDPLHLITVMSAVLHYGMIDEAGAVTVRLTFDHRVLDGGAASRALVDLHNVLLNEILEELSGLRAG